MNFGTGCLIDARVTGEFCEALAASGKPVTFAEGVPSLVGWGVGKATFDWTAEEKLFGKPNGAWNQGPYGICVSTGTGRAIQSSLYWALACGGLIGEPVEIASEPIYGARNKYRRMGDRSPGMFGADAARFAHDCGVVSRDKYGLCDLRTANPELANSLGMQRQGVPQEVLAAGAEYKLGACYRATTAEQARDAVAAGYFGAYCCNTLWQYTHGSTTRDKDGFCVPVGSGGHCVMVCGVFTDRRNDLVFVLRNSWGNTPIGGGPLKLNDGREVALPEGCHAVHLDHFTDGLRDGELWLFAPPVSVWRKPNLKPSEIQ